MSITSSAQRFLLRGILFLLPLFFLPLTADFYDLNKLALLVVGVLLAAVFWAVGQAGRSFKLRVTPLDFPVLAFALAVLISAVFRAPNRVDAFFFPGTATLVVAGTLLYFLVTQTVTRHSRSTTYHSLLTPFLAGGALAGLISLLAGVGAFSALNNAVSLPAWLLQPTFSTAGGLLPAITLFIVLLPLAISGVLESKAGSEELDRGASSYRFIPRSILYSIFTILLVAGLAGAAFHALPGKPTAPQVLSLGSGWSIALEVFEKEPVLGVGPGNFVEAFNRFRPVEFNATPVWNLRFGSSSNWYLHVFTTLGVLGLLALAFLLWRLWTEVYRPGFKMGSKSFSASHYALLFALVLLALVPGNLLLLVSFYLLLGTVAGAFGRDILVELAAAPEASTLHKSNILPAALALVFSLVLLATLYLGGRVYAADISYKKALDAAGRNDGTATYNAMIEAISRNPLRDAYRITYSQVNLALANAIAGNAQQQAGEGGEISEQDRQTISQLVQQAIREAKAAVALNQRRSQNWENLARIYQALIPFAQGADQWTVAAYQQAIALDPMNPVLRVAFGGVFYSLGRYDDAIRVFELAVAAKPDFANAHYNLAVALREKGDTERAIAEMEQVLRLVEQGTQDYGLAQGELEALRGKLAEEREVTASGETLEVQETPTEPVLQPPLELEGAAPPATAPASPIPAPQISPTPAQRPSPSPTQPAQ